MLDVCTGLGYTSIAAAKLPTVSEVVTIELDPLMVYLQRANPWSNDLFEDGKIRRLVGDATEVLPALPDGRFDAVIHDPPANALSGELYSLSFYSELRRVLRPGGLLYHYIGDPSSKASGKLFKGIHERLREAGFASTSTESDCAMADPAPTTSSSGRASATSPSLFFIANCLLIGPGGKTENE